MDNKSSGLDVTNHRNSLIALLVLLSTGMMYHKRSKLRRSTFNQKWIKELNAENWLREAEKDTEAFCKVCQSSFTVAQSGIASVKQHIKTNKHVRNSAVENVMPLFIFFVRQKPQPAPHSSTQAKTMEAELRWVWHTAETSKSFHCEDEASVLFRLMFPDSQIVSLFSCAKDKQSYLLNFAIAPYCREVL